MKTVHCGNKKLFGLNGHDAGHYEKITYFGTL